MGNVCLAIFAACALFPGSNDGSEVSRKEIFDTVWRTVNEHFFDPTFGGVDWEAVGDRFRPEALGADSDEHFYWQLNTMLYQLQVSHLVVIPKDHPEWIGAPSASADGDLGVDARSIDGRAVVTSIRPGSAAEAAGLRPGYVIETVNGKSLDDSKREVLDESKPIPPLDRRTLFTQRLLEQFYGKSGTEVTVGYLNGSGQPIKQVLNREARPGRIQFM